MKNSLLNTPNKLLTPLSGTTSHLDYLEQKQILEVGFLGGKTYQYLNVPPYVWEEYKNEVLNGGSSGVFVNKKIKPVYRTFVQII